MIPTLKKKLNTTNISICLDKMLELQKKYGYFSPILSCPLPQLDLTSLDEDYTYLKNSTVNHRTHRTTKNKCSPALCWEGLTNPLFTCSLEGPRGSLWLHTIRKWEIEHL